MLKALFHITDMITENICTKVIYFSTTIYGRYSIKQLTNNINYVWMVCLNKGCL